MTDCVVAHTTISNSLFNEAPKLDLAAWKHSFVITGRIDAQDTL